MAEEQATRQQEAASSPQEPPQPPAPRKPNPLLKALKESPRARHVLAYSILVVLFLLAWWIGGVRAAGARSHAQEQGVDALSGALAQTALETSPVKVERVLNRIVKEAGYRSITLSDTRGVVTASTDSARRGDRLVDLERAPDKARRFNTSAGPVIRRKVFLAEGNPIASVEVALNPD